MRVLAQLVIALMSFAVSSCSGATVEAVTGTETISLDDGHNVVAQKSADVPRYEIRPCATLVVRLDGYSFAIPPGLKVSGPNAVHLYQGGNKYRARWHGGSRFTLDAQSLECLEGQQVFPGFRKGESFVLGIGHEEVRPGDREIVFRPMWVGAIRVIADGH